MNKKLILFMTSLSLAVTPMGVFASEYNHPTATLAAVEERALLKAATGEYRSWKQYDSRWAGMYMSPGTDTLNESGCLVTSIAILMVHSGSADEYGVDPGKLCTYLSNNGGFTSNSEFYWSKVNGAVEGFALANYKVSLSGSRYDKAAQIKSYLDQGYYAVVSVGHGAHWVAVDRVDSDGNVYIFDPAYSYTSLFGNYSEEGVTRIAIFSSTGQGQGNIDTGNGEVENFSAKGRVNVGASYLNVRNGMGTDKGYLTRSDGSQVTLQNGEYVTITGRGRDSSGNLWYRISIEGMTGYVSGAYIEIVEEENSGITPTDKQGVVNAASVNIRSGAGTNFSVIAVASQNEEVRVVGETKDNNGALWYKVKYKEVEGFMKADYVTIGDSGNNGSETTYPEKSAKVNASSVNVRSGAGTENSVVATLSLNTPVKVTGEAKDGNGATWYKVKFDGGEGYMHSDYVTIDASGDSGNNGGGTTTEPKKGTVNGDYVNVRSGAGTENSRVTSLTNGTAVTIIGEEKDSSGATWYKIQYAGGEGYMHSDYVTVGDSGNQGSTPGEEPSYQEKSAKVNASSVNVRSGAGTNNSVVATLSLNSVVTVIGEEKDSNGATWYKIRYNGGEGYMHSDYVTIDGSSDSGNQGSGTGGTTTETKKGTVNDDYVNVRSGAGTEHNRVTSLSKGTAVTIIGEEKDSSGATWYKIQYAGGEGYMHSDYITVEQNGSGSTGGQDYPMEGIEGKEGIINAELVNVRSGAGSNCEVVTTLKSGVSVLIEDAEKDGEGIIWYRVAFAGTSGYIMAQYIDIQ